MEAARASNLLKESLLYCTVNSEITESVGYPYDEVVSR